MIVEDEPLVALGMSVTLETAGYRVAALADGAESAWEAVIRWRPALVLMDINLKGAIDGIEVARRLQESFGVAILYVTGQAEAATRHRAATVTTPVGYLTKPFTAEQLARGVKAALDEVAPGTPVR